MFGEDVFKGDGTAGERTRGDAGVGELWSSLVGIMVDVDASDFKPTFAGLTLIMMVMTPER